ncbi:MULTISPECIES: SDR family oxidoreductase [unclassified Bradyrhizobium]|uniref:SDR family oxidoreductase n=1 Tax=unclassified Bradyrhizobium TaxID=2631580 RepID=UPI0028EB6E02|nr:MULTISPECIES: SDR family oxidoreductase [unclassified Bradyrhizobium]
MMLLTGATGLAGSFIAQEFVRTQQRVRILVRNRAKATHLELVPTVDLIEGDMSKKDSLGAALEGVVRVLMISGPDRQMVEKQCMFVDACKESGVRHVIKFSGLDARADSAFRFVRMHKEIEVHLENSGLAWTHFRPSGFMQVYLREIRDILEAGELRFALGETRLSPVDLVDVGRVGYCLLRDGGHEGARLDMTGPEALSMSEIAARIAEAVGRPVRYVSVTPSERRNALLARGISSEFADALDEQLEERLKSGAESRVDLSTHRLFGVRPSTFLEFAKRNSAILSGTAAAA